MNKDSVAERKLTSYLLRKDPKLTERDLSSLLNDFRRFVKVVHKIYTEPQAQFQIVEKEIKGKVTKLRVINTDIKELKKVLNKDEKSLSIEETFKRFNKAVTKDKYGR